MRIASSFCKPRPFFVCIKLSSLQSPCSCHWDGKALQPYLGGGPSQVSFTACHPPAKPSRATSLTSASDKITCYFTFLLQNLALCVTSTTDRDMKICNCSRSKCQVRISGHLYGPLHPTQQRLPPALPESEQGSTAGAQRVGRSTG